MIKGSLSNGIRADKPSVSVIIPTHKRPATLREALASVYAQEGAGDEFEMEVVVVYGIPADIPDEIRASFPQARFLQQSGPGPSAARNDGIKASSGRYVAFLDDDNLWLPHKLRVQIPLLENHPEVAVLYGQSVVSGDARLDAWPESAPSGRVFETFLTIHDDFIPTDTLLIPRVALEKSGLFDETIPTDEHYDLCLRLAFYFPFLFQPGPVAQGRFSREGLWHTSILNGAFERTLPYVIEKALGMLPQTVEYEPVRRRARTAVVSTLVKLRWDNGGVDSVRSYLLSALRTYPWIAEEKAVMEHLRVVAHMIARRSESPREALAAFCREYEEAANGSDPQSKLKIRHGLAVLLNGGATGLFATGLHSAALCIFAKAIVHDPIQLIRKDLWKLLGRAAGKIPTQAIARR